MTTGPGTGEVVGIDCIGQERVGTQRQGDRLVVRVRARRLRKELGGPSDSGPIQIAHGLPRIVDLVGDDTAASYGAESEASRLLSGQKRLLSLLRGVPEASSPTVARRQVNGLVGLPARPPSVQVRSRPSPATRVQWLQPAGHQRPVTADPAGD